MDSLQAQPAPGDSEVSLLVGLAGAFIHILQYFMDYRLMETLAASRRPRKGRSAVRQVAQQSPHQLHFAAPW
jgi:hypothetical protein